MSKNLFDFADLSDLPTALQEAMETQTSDKARQYAEVVKAGAAAGFPSLNIRQIEAVANRAAASGALGFTVGEAIPTTATVRAYLNKAVDLKMIGKPTRNSYGADASVVAAGEDEPDAPAAEPVAPAAEVDVLAGL